MAEIEMLEAQIKEIGEKLRQLKADEQCKVVGRAKWKYTHFSGCAPDYWGVLIRCEQIKGLFRESWRTVIQGETKEDAIKQIPEIISDLQKLYELLKGEGNPDG